MLISYNTSAIKDLPTELTKALYEEGIFYLP